MIQTDIKQIENRRFCYQRTDFFIYSLVNLENGKRYIGRSKNPRKRIVEHLNAIKNRRHSNKLLNKDWNCCFGFEILEKGVSYDDRSKEKEYMMLYKTYDENYGYNKVDAYFTRTKRLADAKSVLNQTRQTE